MTMFLTSQDIAELTGIRTGKDKKTREQRQIDALRTMKIVHYVNAAGRPVVARAVIEGGAYAAQQKPAAPGWEPRLVGA
jgi:hypothetical protein